MKYAVWGMLALLAVVHQDVWYWDDPTLVFGFAPIGLLYHAGISVAAAVTWYLATRYCWPDLPGGQSSPPGEGGRGA